MDSAIEIRRSSGLAGGAALLGAALAGTALWTALQARQAERRHRPAGRFLAIDGIDLHYVDEGEGPPVVLLHGNGAMIEDLLASGLVGRLAQRHRVIAFDRPGFGRTARPRDRHWTPEAQADLFRRALQRLGVERPVVFGHSWGTLVALALGLDPRAAVRGLVLVSGYYFPTARADAVLAGLPALPAVGTVLRYTLAPLAARALLPRILRVLFGPREVPARFREGFPIPLALRPGQIRASAEEAAEMPVAAARLAQRYGALAVPVALLAGRDDRLVETGRQTVRMHRAIPQSTLTLLPHTGHMAHYAAGAEIAAAIEAQTAPQPALADRR